MFVLYFQNTTIKMIQYKQKGGKNACNKTTHASTKLHNPCQVKKDYLTYIRKILLQSKYSISNSCYVVKITVHHNLTTVHKNK
jgi:hypothetical protein